MAEESVRIIFEDEAAYDQAIAEAEARGAQRASTGIRVVSVVCPVCHERLEYEPATADDHTAYGTIPIWDVGCAEITITDPTGEVMRHTNAHIADGTHWAALLKQAEYEAERAITVRARLGGETTED